MEKERRILNSLTMREEAFIVSTDPNDCPLIRINLKPLQWDSDPEKLCICQVRTEEFIIYSCEHMDKEIDILAEKIKHGAGYHSCNHCIFD